MHTLPKTYTVSQVGMICGVAPLTVRKWFDSGLLKGHRLPGSTHRRVRVADLVEFLKTHELWDGIPAASRVLFGLEEVV